MGGRMSSSKSKNIIIITLLLLNAILLMIVLFDKSEQRSSQKAEAEALVEVLQQSGISIDEDLDFNISSPAPCTIIRDLDTESTVISQLLTKASRSDLGGNIIYYESAKGQAILRGTGEMDLVFTGELPALGGTDSKAIVRYMEKRGLPLDESSAEKADDNSETIIRIPCELDGYGVYNAVLNFRLSGENVLMINGTRLFDGEPVVSDESVMDCVSALMSFVEIVHDQGYICSRLTGVEAGYFMSVSALGECSLSPVWRISTDTGVLYINAISGKVETLAT